MVHEPKKQKNNRFVNGMKAVVTRARNYVTLRRRYDMTELRCYQVLAERTLDDGLRAWRFGTFLIPLTAVNLFIGKSLRKSGQVWSDLVVNVPYSDYLSAMKIAKHQEEEELLDRLARYPKTKPLDEGFCVELNSYDAYTVLYLNEFRTGMGRPSSNEWNLIFGKHLPNFYVH
ncbi:unnamed protein product [Bursaphelenchus okinawaensis]|uniref:Uncharacterized protein n=1 Tax=Bursaphelenchus okinawaensis TaxID=465554 RepID=A0A811LN52_9BILA|nr:unnamed protein product [Bursaphelenchus okinawaensis]CAG9125172.1 unnamed protein product [Bursaphelenchus okinawaensis]